MTNNYKYILIDADGTFLNFEKTEEAALNRIIDLLGYPDREEFIQTFKKENKKVWQNLEKGKIDGGQVNQLRFKGLVRNLSQDIALIGTREELAEDYLKKLGQGDFLIEGAVEFLTYLSEKYTLILATNGLSQVQRSRLKKAELLPYFDKLAISQELGANKPQISYFQAAMEGYDYEKNQLLMIGDSLQSDMAGADAFGIDSCWFNPEGLQNDGKVNPTYEIKRLDQIRNLL